MKFLYELKDGNCVEGVLMRYKYGMSLCISTQVGCRMGCRFCASTLEGRVRDLTAGEMLGEILCANRYLAPDKEKVSPVVLMGNPVPAPSEGGRRNQDQPSQCVTFNMRYCSKDVCVCRGKPSGNTLCFAACAK